MKTIFGKQLFKLKEIFGIGLFLMVVFTKTLSAQDFPGYRAGNYTGVNGVFFNPANIADSRYRWDFNLFSLSTSVGNNQASFSLKNIGQTFKDDSLINQFVGKNAGTSSGNVNVNINGPSLLFNTGKKSSFALTTRARVMMNATDIDGKLADKLLQDVANDPELPYTIRSAGNMQVSINSWTEFGLSFGQVLKEEGKHFLKGGITLKYLGGVANGYANVGNLNATIDQNNVNLMPYLQNTTGRLELGLGGVDISDFDQEKLSSFQSSGFGGDIGFVYEFRPEHDRYKLDSNSWRRDLNKYKFRIGVALLDIGSIKYERDMQRSGGYDISINGSEKLNLSEFDGVAIDSLKNYFDKNPQYFTPAGGNAATNYRVNLPTTLQIDADYHFNRGFYVSFSGQLSLVNTKSKPYNSQYYSAFAITPRYEGRRFGLYVPISYNQLTNFNAGVSMRLGPLFIGSGSVLTALMGNSRQADVHIGLRFGGLQKNKVKKQEKAQRKAERKELKAEKKANEKPVVGEGG